MTPYDAVAYPGYTHPQTHPNRLATMGTLFGMRPAGVERCRVLELGCGDGGNLVPMAFNLPESEFVGIDLAASAVARGLSVVKELGLRNLELRQGDILGLEPQSGKFDYIIAHGVYSWVPTEVRDTLVRVCKENLAPQGIVFISYNTYPGGHMRMMVRESMLFHVQQFENPQERLHQAMALIKFLAEGQETPDLYGHFLKEELKQMLSRSPGHLYHDELAEYYQPVYFHQFYAHAKRHGLEYVAEANFMEMQDHLFSEGARAALAGLAQNRVLWEQYLDFLKCRRFRQTLLCHQDVKLETRPQLERLCEFYLASVARRESAESELSDGSVVKFQGKKQASVETNLPLAKAALVILGELWPEALQFQELVERARQRLGGTQPSSAAEETALREILLETYRTGLLELYIYRPPYCSAPGEFPMASPLVRWQLRQGNTATNAWHYQVEVQDEVGRQLLLLLDGTRDRAALLKEMQGWRTGGAGSLEKQLEDNLRKVARLGLLVS